MGFFSKDITHPDYVEISPDYHHKLITGEIDNYHFEKRYLHNQDHEIWGLLSVSLVREKTPWRYNYLDIVIFRFSRD